MDSSLVVMALKSGHSATKGSVEVEHYLALEKLNRYKLENDELKELILEKNAAMQTMSTCLLDVEKM